MIGIYKITNIINNKCYIGASKHIEKRFYEHKSYYNNKNINGWNKTLYNAFRKYNIKNFTFEIQEETSIENLYNREKYWIEYFDSYYNGYNDTTGDLGTSLQGELNERAKLTENDIIKIRIAYKNKESRKSVFKLYKDIITSANFSHIWFGRSWKHIMPEVFTDELISFHRSQMENIEYYQKRIY